MERQIGGGTQGVVLATNMGSAIKALIRKEHYLKERDVYLRLQEYGIGQLAGFNVPELISYHDELLVIEMQIVVKPYVLDFASAYLDCEPPYLHDQHIMAEWERSKRDEFEDRWPEVLRLMSKFKAMGIHLADVKPSNVSFAD